MAHTGTHGSRKGTGPGDVVESGVCAEARAEDQEKTRKERKRWRRRRRRRRRKKQRATK
ncbi:hypothetical protein WH47_08946 [Habropoda laboriosa]|uniref:Uncharacterized protein n=1 Tax=Habropoda laboriosa TaxID=597456 RepID=A0A0L7R6T0_9HYME|nr:hypothetical protein WH47_08946 [Habropoda laboriosa]